MIIFIILMIITGIGFLSIINEKLKLSYILSYSLILGLGIHTLLFTICAILNIYYGIPLISIISIIFLIIILFRLKKIKIEKDFKLIPILYILILLVGIFRFYQFTSTGFVSFYHWDELRIYQFVSKQIYLTHNMNYIYSFFAPMSYYIGNSLYSFIGLSLTSPRMLNGFLFANISLMIYFGLVDNKVNRKSAAIIATLYLFSSVENLIYYRSFYNNILYTLFFTSGIYLVCKEFFIDKKDNISILGYSLLLLSILTRREGIFEIIAFLIILFGYLIYKKRIKILNASKYLIIPIVFEGIWIITRKLLYVKDIYPGVDQIVSSNKSGFLLKSNLSISNIVSYIKNAFIQLFQVNAFYSNYIVFGISIFLIIYVIYKLVKKEEKDYLEFFIFILIAQLIYFGIIFATQAFIMNEREFQSAASISRYLLSVAPINFILFGMVIFDKNKDAK